MIALQYNLEHMVYLEYSLCMYFYSQDDSK